MRKISTLFKKDPNDLGSVINEVAEENEWALMEGIPTVKWDGSACAIIGGKLYKRYDVKKGRQVPENSIPCQEPDPITGHWPHWVLCRYELPEDKYHFEALDLLSDKKDGTYELVGPKINGNNEGLNCHELIRHGTPEIHGLTRSWDGIMEFLKDHNIEGIVFHHPDGRMCKIRKSDFGFKKIK